MFRNIIFNKIEKCLIYDFINSEAMADNNKITNFLCYRQYFLSQNRPKLIGINISSNCSEFLFYPRQSASLIVPIRFSNAQMMFLFAPLD